MILKCLLITSLISLDLAFSAAVLPAPKECVIGSTYWCKNIQNAKECHAVKHCIQTVWEHKTLPPDEGNVCKVCKDMVNEARETLRSNTTLENVKEVFDAQCNILFKPAREICTELVNKYAPELLDILDSQMNPDVVCSVVGLCYNDALNKMDQDIQNKKQRDEERNKELQVDCKSCMHVANLIDVTIKRSSPEDIVRYFTNKCLYLGSFSDSCAKIVEEYSSEIYNKLSKDFSQSGFCYLTGSCINGYDRTIQVKTESNVGVIHLNNDAVSMAVKHTSDDLTCDFCKQMINHLKDILVANSTKAEFKQVLKGLCRQTGKFSSECNALADEYYDKVYDYISQDMKPGEVCTVMELCATPNYQIPPMLPEHPVPINEMMTGNVESNIGHISISKGESNVRVFTPFTASPMKVEISFGDPMETRFQLPVERLTVPRPVTSDVNVNGKEACVFCQYLLHYIQKVISQPYGEKEIKKIAGEVCDKLPDSVTLQCKNFIEEYGDAFIAILAQEIDPSQVCPSLKICPAEELSDRYDPTPLTGKPGCFLCLMTVEDVTEKLKNNKTEENIRDVLRNVCTRLPSNLKPQCVDFIQEYTEYVIDMLIADFTPQEVCTFLKLCHVNPDVELVKPTVSSSVHLLGHELLTNEIPKDEPVEVPVPGTGTNQRTCILCEFVMDKLKDELNQGSTEDDVRRALRQVCNHMPVSIENDCRDFVNRFSHTIIQMLEEVDPDKVCSAMHMCKENPHPHAMVAEIGLGVEECALCEVVVGAIHGLLEDKRRDLDLAHEAMRICSNVRVIEGRCMDFISNYGALIINLLNDFGMRSNFICSKLNLCESQPGKVDMIDTQVHTQPQVRPHLIGARKCTWGPAYWCHSEDHARECGTLAHCRELVWKAERPVPAA